MGDVIDIAEKLEEKRKERRRRAARSLIKYAESLKWEADEKEDDSE